ncbi:PKD domain-containing protein [Marivirga salinae]|uniref:PKD domain-containing protein n=1 Tax=Marivirga salinarum TaxID=3059078 RepID=A0AA51N8E3_9BACT|nr:PKD domain-containing protein [Marivirga sp. BDSF4-3]WMN10716.1 PKD domain-containing protein [Marivirga sp. BDSF4-3]
MSNNLLISRLNVTTLSPMYKFTFLFLLCSHLCLAQQINQSDTVVREAKIESTVLGNSVKFGVDTPPLIQISGAPKGYYTFFWEFGDGEFSKEENPEHTFDKRGDYNVKLWVTNNYDAGKTPTTRPEKVKIDSVNLESNTSASLLGENNIIDFTKNREPIPNEDLVVVLTYKNPYNEIMDGRLYFFYNESIYKSDNFQLTDIRTYHGEYPIITEDRITDIDANPFQSMLASNGDGSFKTPFLIQDTTDQETLQKKIEESKKKFKEMKQIGFSDFQPGEERNIFFQLRTTPEMLKDTSAIISIRSVYIPNSNSANHSVKEMEMEIVTSHDPNKMTTNANLMDFRNRNQKDFKYKIQFQNNGEGPANTVRLETDIPEIFDQKEIELLDFYPKCEICPEVDVAYSCLDTTFLENKIIFTFKNIYLPGSNQKGVNSYDSTKGFVSYKIPLKGKIKKQKTQSQTAIYFDKNDPIITNYATTRFTPGLSVGIKAGVMRIASLQNYQEWFLGATLSSYQAFKGYLQSEVMIGSNNYTNSKTFTERTQRDEFFTEVYDYEQQSEFQNLSFYLVPTSYRYNLTDFLAVGAGLQIKWDIRSKIERETTGEYTEVVEIEDYERRVPERDTFEQETISNTFTNFNSAAFLDLNVGKVRIGPSVGIRYHLYFTAPTHQWQFYASWKF